MCQALTKTGRPCKLKGEPYCHLHNPKRRVNDNTLKNEIAELQMKNEILKDKMDRLLFDFTTSGKYMDYRDLDVLNDNNSLQISGDNNYRVITEDRYNDLIESDETLSNIALKSNGIIKLNITNHDTENELQRVKIQANHKIDSFLKREAETNSKYKKIKQLYSTALETIKKHTTEIREIKTNHENQINKSKILQRYQLLVNYISGTILKYTGVQSTSIYEFLNINNIRDILNELNTTPEEFYKSFTAIRISRNKIAHPYISYDNQTIQNIIKKPSYIQ